MASEPQLKSSPRAVRLAVAGNPNTGKTTLFNALTGLRHKIGNYPGVTVEHREGRATIGGTAVTLLDLPGTYSLSARSPDEQIARDVLLGCVPGVDPVDGVLIVVDASNLERNLYLATQILDLGLPAVIACNMIDLAEQEGTRLDLDALSAELGLPVVPTVGSRGGGLDRLREAIAAIDPQPAARRAWRLPESCERAVAEVSRTLRETRHCAPSAADGAALLLLVDAAAGVGASRNHLPPAVAESIRGGLNGVHRDGDFDLAALAVERRYAWIEDIVARSTRNERAAGPSRDSLSDRIDRVLTHKVFGAAIFAAVMFLMFVSIFWWAEPLMRLIEVGQEQLQLGVRALLPAGPLRDLIADGVIGGAGAVVVFFPQICILFLFIGVLEDSGYMARAAFLMDRVMSSAGLHGKSFIPLLSSYACAVPGIMATRTIEDPRDRFTTILVAPLMSCSARLPVYLTIIGAVFSASIWLKAGVIFSMYALGTLAALAMAALLKRTLLRGPRPAFIMELPPYHLPRPRQIIVAMWDRASLFLTRAGTTIVAVCIILWALAYFPRHADPALDARARATVTQAGLGTEALARPDALPEPPRDELRAIENERAGAQVRHSWIGQLGRVVEPALRPLGFDWRVGIGVLASFAAREVFVSTMGVVYFAGADEAAGDSLRQRMRAATWESGPQAGRPIFTPLAGISLMVFYVMCCQCVSTLAVVRRETNSWRWPAFMFSYMTVLAYAASLVVYQLGSRLGWGV